jgi:DNA-binding MarR family transcriptional regulator
MGSEKKDRHSGRQGMGLPDGALYRMTEVVRHREKRLSALLALQGLSLHEWRALRILYSFPGDVAMSEVIAHSQTDRTALGRTITQLVNRGWVARFPDPEDKRAVYLRVMPASRPIFDQARQWVADYDAQLMACLDDAGLSALDNALQRMLLFLDTP